LRKRRERFKIFTFELSDEELRYLDEAFIDLVNRIIDVGLGKSAEMDMNPDQTRLFIQQLSMSAVVALLESIRKFDAGVMEDFKKLVVKVNKR